MSSVDSSLGRLARSAGIVFVGIVLGHVLGLVGEVLLARTLGPATFGHVALAYTVVSTVGSLAHLGVEDGITRLLSADKSSANWERVVRSGYVVVLFGGVVAAVIVYLFRFRLAAVMNDETLPWLLVAFVPYVLVYPFSKVSFAALRASQRSINAVVSREVGPRVLGLIAFGAFALTGETLVGAVAYWLAIPATIAVLSLYYLRRDLPFGDVVRRLPDRETLAELWSFSWPLAFSTSIFVLLSNLDVLMIGYFLDSQAVGFYRAISPLRGATMIAVGAFSFLFLPVATTYYSNGNIEGLNRLYIVSTKWTVLATFPFVVVFSVFAPEAVRTFFGPAYAPAAPALVVLIVGTFVRTLTGLDGDVVKAIDRPQIELTSAVVGLVANGVLNLVLIPEFGIVGAAAATVAGYGLYNIVEVAVIYRAIGSHPFSLDSIKPLVPTALVGVVLARLTADIELGLVGLIAAGGLIAVVQLLSVVLTRSLDETDVLLIERVEERSGIDLSWFKSGVRRRS